MDDPHDIYHWHRLDHRLTSSGQPSEGQLAALAALGVRHVINLAPHSHAKALADEGGSLARLGVGYSNIPVDFRNPTEADFARFCAAMEAHADAALHVHCAANYRVAAFLYRYRRAQGVAEATARADLDQVWTPEGVWVEFVHRV